MIESHCIQAVMACLSPGVLWPASSGAQTDDPHIETAVRITALVLNSSVNGGGLGVGSRFGCSLTSHFGLEGEVNRFPGGGTFSAPNLGVPGGPCGVKAGLFVRDTGLFLKRTRLPPFSPKRRPRSAWTYSPRSLCIGRRPNRRAVFSKSFLARSR